MGCGSSSLKGDDVPNVNSQPVATTTTPGGQPLRKVQTNFSDINYEQDIHKRRLTEYAPHETPPPIREQSHDLSAEQNIGNETRQQQRQNDDLGPDQPDPSAGLSTAYPHEGAGPAANAIDGEPDRTLKPYQTTDGGDWDNDTDTYANQHPTSHQAQPYVNGTQDTGDPTSSYVKDDFASTNDPANPLNQESHHAYQPANDLNNNDDDAAFYTPNPDIHDSENPERKKSWLGQKYSSYQSAKRGTGASDEDIAKYTGKDRDELHDWAKDRPGVGGNQHAGRVDTDSGLVAGGSWN